MLSFAFSAIIIILCITIVFMLLRFFKSQLKTSYKMVSKFQEEAEQLKSATVHWLRHTGISEDVKFRPREHVRDDAGHGSSAITDKYIDVELRARHASAKNKKIKS